MAVKKLSAIASGGATAGATDVVVAVRSGTTDVLVTPVALDTAQTWTGVQTFANATTILGTGDATASITGSTLRGVNATGTNIAGITTNISASLGTGTGNEGIIIFNAAVAKAATGTTAHTLAGILQIGSTQSSHPDGNGIFGNILGPTWVDENTAASGTAARACGWVFQGITLDARNSNVTTTTAATLSVRSSVSTTGNMTVTNKLSFWVQNGLTRFDNFVGVGSHPLAVLHVSFAFSAAAWGVSGICVRQDTRTTTDSSSSGTVASCVVNAFGGAALAASSVTTFTNSATLYLVAPTASTNVTLTAAYGLWNTGATLLAPIAFAGGTVGLTLTPGAHTAMTAEKSDLLLSAHTITITGAYANQRSVLLNATTITAASSLTITNADTLHIAGISTASGSAVISGSTAIRVPVAPQASANVGLISLGSGAWDGATSGFFAGSSSGTHIAVNAASGFAGNPLDLQVAGVSQFKISATGTATHADGGNIVTGTSTGMIVATATGQKLAFHNSTPVIQRTGAAQAAVVTTAAALASYGYTEAQANAIVSLVNELRAALVEKGLIKGSS